MLDWGDIMDYPELDLSRFKEPGSHCVRCETEHESQWFLAAMKRQYKDKSSNWSFPHDNWRRCESSGHMDMFPNLNCSDRLRYSSDGKWADRNGYNIVTFSEAFLRQDFGEFEHEQNMFGSLFAES